MYLSSNASNGNDSGSEEEDEIEIADKEEDEIEIADKEEDELDTKEEFDFNHFISKKKTRVPKPSTNKQPIKYTLVKLSSTTLPAREKKDTTIWNTIGRHVVSSNTKVPQRNIARIKNEYNRIILPKGTIIKNPIDSFTLFFDYAFFETITIYTNQKGRAVMTSEWKETNPTELQAFVGLLIASGVMKSNFTADELLWNHFFGSLIYRGTMSLRRFRELRRFIRFDDADSRQVRRTSDKLAPIRDLWTKFENRLASFYKPGFDLTIDEQMVPFKGRCPFRVYNGSKPDKFGLIIYWIVDSVTFYPLHAIPYLGKTGHQLEGGLAATMVKKLTQPFNGTARNITCDNFFTNKPVAMELLKNKITVVGTVRSNKSWVPSVFVQKRPLGSCLYGYTKNETLLSFQAKKDKVVLIYSTMHIGEQIHEDNHKPLLVQYYNANKSGVDSLDQMLHEYTTKRQTQRWPFAFWSNMLDTGMLASYKIFILKNPEWMANATFKRAYFLLDIAKTLIFPYVKNRKTIGLQKNLQCEVQLLLSKLENGEIEEDEDGGPIVIKFPFAKLEKEPAQKKVRCRACPWELGRTSARRCNICSQCYCAEHSFDIILCKTCIDNCKS